jgi:CBS domain-containing protein
MPVAAALRKTKLRELRPAAPLCLDRQTTLSGAIEAMHSQKASCALVCDNDRIAGILTERDILNKVAGETVSFDSSVEHFMTRDPKVLTADDYLSDAVLLMESGDYRHVPIVDREGRVEGMVSIHNIIDLLAEIFPEEVLNLPPRTDQYMTTREGE